MVTITQPAFNRKQHKAASDLVLSTSHVAENAAQINAHDLEKVIADYILCVQNLRQPQYAESMLDILSNQRSILEKLVQNSIYKPSELTLLSIDQQTLRSQTATYTAHYLRDLSILSGVNNTSYQELIPSDLALNTSRETSCFLGKYKLDSINLIAQQNSFETKYLPQINLFANISLNAVYVSNIHNRFEFSVGLSLSYPLSDGG